MKLGDSQLAPAQGHPSSRGVEIQEDDGLLEECSDRLGRFRFSYEGLRLDVPPYDKDSRATSGVCFWLPTEFLEEHGPARVKELAAGRGLTLSQTFSALL
jgi:hypothetical protein